MTNWPVWDGTGTATLKRSLLEVAQHHGLPRELGLGKIGLFDGQVADKPRRGMPTRRAFGFNAADAERPQQMCRGLSHARAYRAQVVAVRPRALMVLLGPKAGDPGFGRLPEGRYRADISWSRVAPSASDRRQPFRNARVEAVARSGSSIPAAWPARGTSSRGTAGAELRTDSPFRHRHSDRPRPRSNTSGSRHGPEGRQ